MTNNWLDNGVQFDEDFLDFWYFIVFKKNENLLILTIIFKSNSIFFLLAPSPTIVDAKYSPFLNGKK